VQFGEEYDIYCNRTSRLIPGSIKVGDCQTILGLRRSCGCLVSELRPRQQMDSWSSRSRSGGVYGLIQWLQLEDRIPRRQIVKCFHWRSLRDQEEPLYLAGEAVKIGFEDRWTLAGRELAHGIAVAAHRASEDDFACRADISHPIGFAAGADQVAPPIEVKRVHRERDYLAALSSANFENVEVAADQTDPNEGSEDTTQDALSGAWPEIARTTPGHHLLPKELVIDVCISGVPYHLPKLGGVQAHRTSLGRNAAGEQCDFSGIFHRYILMGDSAKLARAGAAGMPSRTLALGRRSRWVRPVRAQYSSGDLPSSRQRPSLSLREHREGAMQSNLAALLSAA
jgi:hypothetical protein